ncbi:YpoC family protein [Kurthia sibirica]|uniref:YpoC-like domain-containing protein n=1 Tax=Kurthia sibirica TaxID=202750 RepID=A0A2U3AI47_9BACL|nr:hypothetical protein [Kurthia sibirica]PWI24223.1 hypothetical protein DEX24_14495 [Kurthia sibirica]GEK34120.1 hypothetical protein KSI01_16530 [Kurthia sibirica]
MIVCMKEAITKDRVDKWLEQWGGLQPQIEAAHKRRDRSAGTMMEAGILLYKQFIAEASDSNVFDTTQQYELLPINAMERLAFIDKKPGQYACYRQLDELFIETKKRCARLRLKK